MSVRRKVLYLILVILAIGVYNGYYADISLEDLKKEYANEHSKFVDVDGLQVHYRDEGSGFPIVLVHGTAASLHTWDGWAKKLKENYRVIRMDLPAFGLTGPNAERDYSIKAYTNFLNAFANEIKIDSFHLAGNSLGGNIAWNYAAEYSNKVAKLILVDASGLPTNTSQPLVFKMAKTPAVNAMFLFITPKMFIRKNIEEVYADDTKITDALITRYHKMALREGNRQAFIDRANMDFKLGSIDNLEKLKSVQNKTLLLWGKQDKWIPLDNGYRMHKILPNSTLTVLENSGHVPMEENPLESLAIVVDFLVD